jgi:hypothetical protein
MRKPKHKKTKEPFLPTLTEERKKKGLTLPKVRENHNLKKSDFRIFIKCL